MCIQVNYLCVFVFVCGKDKQWAIDNTFDLWPLTPIGETPAHTQTHMSPTNRAISAMIYCDTCRQRLLPRLTTRVCMCVCLHLDVHLPSGSRRDRGSDLISEDSAFLSVTTWWTRVSRINDSAAGPAAIPQKPHHWQLLLIRFYTALVVILPLTFPLWQTGIHSESGFIFTGIGRIFLVRYNLVFVISVIITLIIGL